MLEEDAWRQHLPITLKSPFPNNKTSLLNYAARFVSLVRHDCFDNEIEPSNPRTNIVKDVIANRLFGYLILSRVIGKINTNCKNQGSSWNEALVHRFQKKNSQAPTINFNHIFERWSLLREERKLNNEVHDLHWRVLQ